MWDEVLGKPFKDGGRGPDSFDCWGLVAYVYQKYFGIRLIDYRIACMESARIYRQYLKHRNYYPLVTGSKPVPCLVLMRFNSAMINHVGVYVGGGKFLHAREGAGVCLESVDSPLWKMNIREYRTAGGLDDD
jgi:cell wall-associated NlpC family hydrolase